MPKCPKCGEPLVWPGPQPNDERNVAIYKARVVEGRPLKDIAAQYGISAPRVRKIVLREIEKREASLAPA
jgi:DNA-directed RNA polymerase specialized sigma subunit